MKTTLNEKYVFETFITKKDNLAFVAAKTIVEKPGSEYNPVIFYGDYGTGKTHLLQAIGNKLKKHYDVIYSTAEMFVCEYVEAIRNSEVNNLREKYGKASVVLIDGIQLFQHKDRVTEEFCVIFDILYDKNIQIVLTCDRPPLELIGISAKMFSRIKGGLILNVSSLDFEIKCEIIKNIAAIKNIPIKKEQIENIANNMNNDIREIHSKIAIMQLNLEQKKYINKINGA
jgi:chromosomal replication initiator protein